MAGIRDGRVSGLNGWVRVTGMGKAIVLHIRENWLNDLINSRMRITHVTSVMFLHFLSFLLSTGRGGGYEHEPFLANLPRHDHYLAQDPPHTPSPLGMRTCWLHSTRYAIDIQIAFFFWSYFIMLWRMFLCK